MSRKAQYQNLVCSILKKVRGSTSQSHLSARMGLKHNHVYKWESGARKIQWQDFVSLCRQKKVDLGPLLFELYLYSGDPSDTKSLCEKIFMDLSSPTLAKKMGVSRFRVDGWRKGKGLFYLQDWVRILDKFSHHLPDFALYFLERDEVIGLGIDLTEYDMRKFEMENPIFSLILRTLETEKHIQSDKSSENFLAARLSLGDDEIRFFLKKGSDLGFLTKKRNKFFSNSRHIDIRGKSAIEQRKFWLQQAIKYCEMGKVFPPNNVFGNLVYCISKSGQGKILDEYFRFFNRVRQIIEEDRGGDIPMIINYQMLRMDE